MRFPPDVPEARTLERFVRGTDLETGSVYLHAQAIPEYYDLCLQGVSWKPDSLHVDLCRDLKPANETCSVDADVAVGHERGRSETGLVLVSEEPFFQSGVPIPWRDVKPTTR